MLCTNCNAQLEYDDVFCGDCGTPVESQANTAHAADGMSCSNCGQPMEMDDVFCGDCGTPFTPPQIAYAAPEPPPPVYNPPPPPSPPPPVYQPPPAPAIAVASASTVKMPLVFVIDTSADTASYLGELNKELNNFKATLSSAGQVASMLEVAVVQFGERHSLVQDFTNVQYMNAVELVATPVPNSAFDPPLREALRLVGDYTRRQRPTHKAWLVFVVGSSPVDDISSIANDVKSAQGLDALRLIALGVDKCDFSALNRLTDVVFRQDGVSFASFFEWLFGCMKAISQTPHGQKPQLPNLKGNVYRDK